MTGQTVILSGPKGRAVAHRLIEAAPEMAVVTVAPPRRTTDQNARMWAMLSDVSRSKPGGRMLTPEVWKCLFMHALGHQVRFEMGLSGEPFPVGFHSSRLSKAQMSDLMEFIGAWGAENDVEWSAP